MKAVCNVDLQHIWDAVSKRKKEDDVHRDLENCIRILETVQQSPTAGIRAQMNQASISMQTPAHYPAAPIRTNKAAFGRGGGQGNLFNPRAGQIPAA